MEDFKQFLDRPTPDVKAIARKHRVDVAYVRSQLKKGIRVEMEHTTQERIAKEIALDHLNEDPKYYIKLAKVEKE